MKLLANENIPLESVRNLRSSGHDVLSISERVRNHISHSLEVRAPEMLAPLSIAGHTPRPCGGHDVTNTVVTRRARRVGISERVYADGNVDRRVESAGVDILERHLRDANADPVAICLLDA